jgi:hypothetical protein
MKIVVDEGTHLNADLLEFKEIFGKKNRLFKVFLQIFLAIR